MEQRWSFVVPWCTALKGHIKFDALECQVNYADTWKNHLQVTLPSRDDVEGENTPTNSTLFLSPEENFQLKFQKTREALAVLAAVAHVDDKGWKYLLMEHCGVNLGEEGCEARDKILPAKFVLFMELGGDHIKEGKFDLVTFCGVQQRTNCSPEYLDTLQKIAELDAELMSKKKGVEVMIPVRLHASSCMDKSGSHLAATLAEIAKEEKMVKEEWGVYEKSEQKNEGMKKGSIRCTFVLEPMIADFSGCGICGKTAQAIERLVRENVRTSEVSLRFQDTSELETGAPMQQKQTLYQLTSSLFDSTRRPIPPVNYVPGVKIKSDELQFGMVHLQCDIKLEGLDMAALFSALAVTQTTSKVSILVYRQIYGNAAGTAFWKWIAYAFFSKRARLRSSVESLIFADMGLVSKAQAEAFAAIMVSDHPEADLFGLPPGRTADRDATLKAYPRLRWRSGVKGNFVNASRFLKLDAPIRPVRTFSDNGNSAWVNVLVPGIGHCQVQRDDLTFDQDETMGVDIITELTSFSIRYHGFMMFAGDHLPLLLKNMGPMLKFLKIVCPTDDFDNIEILRSCPNLQKNGVLERFCKHEF